MVDLVKQKFSRMHRSPFARNVFTLQISNGLIIFLSFLTSIILARILGPKEYGMYSLGFAFFAMLMIFLDYGSEQAILTLMAEADVRGDDDEEKRIVTYFFKISVYKIATVGLLFFWLLPGLAQTIYRNAEIGYLVRFLLVAYLARFSFVLIQVVLQVVKRIKALAVLETVNKFFYLLIPVLLVINYRVPGIFWGNLAVAIIFLFFSLGLYWRWTKKYDFLPNFSEIKKNFFKAKIGRYFKFGFLIAFDKNLAGFYSLLPILFLGRFVATDQVAFYKIALSYVGIPLMILEPISRLLLVKFPEFKLDSKEKLRKNLFRVSALGLMISLLAVLFFVFPAQFLVKIFYGESFKPSAPLIYWLAVYAGFSGLGIALGAIYRTMNKMVLAIKINLIIIAFQAVAGYFLVMNFGIIGAVIMMIIFPNINNIISLFAINRAIKKHRFNN